MSASNPQKTTLEYLMDCKQCRAARGLLNWTIEILSEKSGVSEKSIGNFERGKRKLMPQNLSALVRAFEQAGIEFINGGIKEFSS